jgi:hypothetical protein
MFTNNTVAANIDALIDNARAKVIGQYESTYGANVDYARLLNQKWADFDWFDLKHTDTSDEGKAVKGEGDRFRKGIKQWHSNPSTAWKQIRDHARTDKYGKPSSVEDDLAELQADEGEGAKHNRSPLLRNIEELTVLFKFNRKQEALTEDLRKAQGYIIQALGALHIDVTMIGD